MLDALIGEPGRKLEPQGGRSVLLRGPPVVGVSGHHHIRTALFSVAAAICVGYRTTCNSDHLRYRVCPTPKVQGVTVLFRPAQTDPSACPLLYAVNACR